MGFKPDKPSEMHMNRLSRADLWSLEEYSERRVSFKSKVMAHKKTRQVALGDNARLYFEDDLTIRYQIQEMLRIEKVFEASGIDEELDVYNPLIPDGSNFKATFMLEYDDIQERQKQLAQLVGVEDRVWIQIGEGEKVWPVADEDLERSTDEKTSSVHFMRWELSSSDVQEVKNGTDIRMGIDHSGYKAEQLISQQVRDSLANDLVAQTLN